MRSIEIPQAVVQRAAKGPIQGTCLEFAVAVDWPELRLPEEQIMANAIALANGEPAPFPDPSVFMVRVPYAVPRG